MPTAGFVDFQDVTTSVCLLKLIEIRVYCSLLRWTVAAWWRCGRHRQTSKVRSNHEVARVCPTISHFENSLTIEFSGPGVGVIERISGGVSSSAAILCSPICHNDSANSDNLLTVCGKPCWCKVPKNSSTFFGGFLSRCLIERTAEITRGV